MFTTILCFAIRILSKTELRYVPSPAIKIAGITLSENTLRFVEKTLNIVS